MKKIIFITLTISLLSIAAVSTKYVYKPAEQKPVFVLLDSAKIYDLKAVKAFKASPAAMAEAYRLYNTVKDYPYMPDSACRCLPALITAIRTCPMSELYE